jgi:hypothetical protein
MDLSAFYGAFSPACFALLGLWLLLEDTAPARSWPHAKAE